MKHWTIEEIEARLSQLVVGGADSTDLQQRGQLRILEVATDHFIRYGYRRANIGDIAKEAGIGKGTLYLHFESKKTLLLACVALEKMAIVPALAEVMKLPESERLEPYLRAILLFVLTAKLNAMLLGGDAELAALMNDLGPDNELVTEHARGEALTLSLIEAVTPTLSPEQQRAIVVVLHTAFPGSIHGATAERRGDMSVEQFAEVFAGILARGVASTPADN